MMKKVNIIDKKIVFDDFYKIEEAILQYELPDGTMTEPMQRLCFVRGDSVAGVVYNTDTRKAIFVKQFRYAAYNHGEAWIVEVVAGILKEGHNPVDEMKREVLEEVGYETTLIEHIATFYASPGGSSERVYLYYIEVNNKGKVAQGGGLEEESENIEIIEYGIEELKDVILKDGIPDAKSIIACNYLLAKHK